MSSFCPYTGLHVYMMTPAEAERCDRVSYHVPPENGLGWVPYTIRVQSYGATAYKAFHSARELRAWLGGFTLKPAHWNRRGFRSFTVASPSTR